MCDLTCRFNYILMLASVCSGFGREFHAAGPAYENALLPNTMLSLVSSYRRLSAIHMTVYFSYNYLHQMQP